MSGIIKNSWSKFLNGGQTYNFKYKDEGPPMPEPMPIPASTAAPAQSPPKNVILPAPVPLTEVSAPPPKKGKKAIMPAQTGGKRKTRRDTKKHRHSRHHRK